MLAALFFVTRAAHKIVEIVTEVQQYFRSGRFHFLHQQNGCTANLGQFSFSPSNFRRGFLKRKVLKS
jgi:hypothetical protein